MFAHVEALVLDLVGHAEEAGSLEVKGAPGFPPGEEPTLSRFYTSHWDDSFFGGKFVWSHRFQNMIILVAFILFFRFATFYALERINYATR